MMRRLAPLLLLLLVACGQEGAGIGEAAAAALEPRVQQVRAAATTGDRAGAARELAELRRTVADLRQRGELTEDGAARVLAAAAEVEARLGTTTTPTTVAATGVPPTTRGTGATTRTAREAEEEARKRAEEAAKKAEEEAKKRADEAKKRAEEGKKD
ncbi:MAG: hypothetical protein AVDCRST_MAG10-1464 [uncultured Acidimicrobiales bacterium]|uniref:Mucin-associated surface protein n=1 Tax=uncultured Acidimicrobiales bacterium TaxID=310071 RepID=A0A6J4I1J5_9ACTN|nr:MAG: hypothetical protein AVDCRST_MAG10-1464 [uncultured Acidimicrobiales bacterium]